jgi:hypothetical protein
VTQRQWIPVDISVTKHSNVSPTQRWAPTSCHHEKSRFASSADSIVRLNKPSALCNFRTVGDRMTERRAHLRVFKHTPFCRLRRVGVGNFLEPSCLTSQARSHLQHVCRRIHHAIGNWERDKFPTLPRLVGQDPTSLLSTSITIANRHQNAQVCRTLAKSTVFR